MADSLPSPPTSRASTPHNLSSTAGKNELINRLDELLEQYLEVLDEYSRLREELSKSFVNGFMSLARAQRTSNLGPGRRYGQDGYDGRMKALKRVRIDRTKRVNEPKGNGEVAEKASQREDNGSIDQEPEVHAFMVTSKLSSNSMKEAGQKVDTSEQGLESPLQTSAALSDNEHSQKREKPKMDPAYRDPVTWYGILVPSPLRHAQRSFSLSVDDLIPKLLTTTGRLQLLEARIHTVRTDLGLQRYYDEDETEQSRLPLRSVKDSAT